MLKLFIIVCTFVFANGRVTLGRHRHRHYRLGAGKDNYGSQYHTVFTNQGFTNDRAESDDWSLKQNTLVNQAKYYDCDDAVGTTDRLQFQQCHADIESSALSAMSVSHHTISYSVVDGQTLWEVKARKSDNARARKVIVRLQLNSNEQEYIEEELEMCDINEISSAGGCTACALGLHNDEPDDLNVCMPNIEQTGTTPFFALSNAAADAVGQVIVTFDTHNDIPVDGKVVITLANYFDASGATFSSATSPGNCWGNSQTISTITSNNVDSVTIQRTYGTGTVPCVGSIVIVLDGVKNPSYDELDGSGNTVGQFKIETQTTYSTTIDKSVDYGELGGIPSINLKQADCAVATIPHGIDYMSGENCESGAINVADGTTCLITESDGYRCTDPGMCTDGSFYDVDGGSCVACNNNVATGTDNDPSDAGYCYAGCYKDYYQTAAATSETIVCNTCDPGFIQLSRAVSTVSGTTCTACITSGYSVAGICSTGCPENFYQSGGSNSADIVCTSCLTGGAATNGFGWTLAPSGVTGGATLCEEESLLYGYVKSKKGGSNACGPQCARWYGVLDPGFLESLTTIDYTVSATICSQLLSTGVLINSAEC